MVVDILLADQLKFFIVFAGRQNGVCLDLSSPIWRLDPATIIDRLAADFLLFGRPVEWALNGENSFQVIYIYLGLTQFISTPISPTGRKGEIPGIKQKRFYFVPVT